MNYHCLWPTLDLFSKCPTFFYVSITCHLDIDECKDDNYVCDVNANCTNTYGSYNCTCKEGYTGNGRSCSGTKFIIIKFYFSLKLLYVFPSFISLKAGILHWLSSVYWVMKTDAIWIKTGKAHSHFNCNKQNHITNVQNKFIKNTFTTLAI